MPRPESLFEDAATTYTAAQGGNWGGALQSGGQLVTGVIQATHADQGPSVGAGVAATVSGAVGGVVSGLGTAVLLGASIGTAGGPIGLAAGAVVGLVVGAGAAFFSWWEANHGQVTPPPDPPELDLNHRNLVANAKSFKAFLDASPFKRIFVLQGLYGRVAAIAAIPETATLAEYLADPTIAELVTQELTRRGVSPNDPALAAYKRALLGATPWGGLINVGERNRRLTNTLDALNQATALGRSKIPQAATLLAANPGLFGGTPGHNLGLAPGSSGALRQSVIPRAASVAAVGGRPQGGQSMAGALPTVAMGAAFAGALWYFLRGD